MEENCMLRRSECRAKGGAPGFKVAILGAAGGIGQPLALLMKMNPLVSVLHLYDVINTPGVTADTSHMDTGAVVSCTSLPLPFYSCHLYLALFDPNITYSILLFSWGMFICTLRGNRD
jgi:lactate/malate dehydrogenase, NAD binding domain